MFLNHFWLIKSFQERFFFHALPVITTFTRRAVPLSLERDSQRHHTQKVKRCVAKEESIKTGWRQIVDKGIALSIENCKAIALSIERGGRLDYYFPCNKGSHFRRKTTYHGYSFWRGWLGFPGTGKEDSSPGSLILHGVILDSTATEVANQKIGKTTTSY